MSYQNKVRSFQLIFLLFLLVLTACSVDSPGQLPTIPAPEAGKATLVGRIVSPDGTPLADTPVRLANVDRDYLASALDPSMHHSVPYMLTTSGIAYLQSRVEGARVPFAAATVLGIVTTLSLLSIPGLTS